MLYLQLKERIHKGPQEKVWAGDVAQIGGEKAGEAQKVLLFDGLSEGVWKVTPDLLLEKLMPLGEEITFLGEKDVKVHVSQQEKHPFLRQIRAALAFLLLFFGSALAITWFHADVGMQEAQNHFFMKLSGRLPVSEWEMAIPYALGVGLGVALYYGLFSGRKTVSPLDIKLSEYMKKNEEQAGKKP